MKSVDGAFESLRKKLRWIPNSIEARDKRVHSKTMARLTNNAVLMLIVGLVFAGTIHAAKQPTIDSSSENESNESNRIDNVDSKQPNENGDEQMAVSDQISVLSRQLKMLTERRQEDYRMLERSLHSYVQKHFEEYINVDIKKELKDFRWAIENTEIWKGVMRGWCQRLDQICSVACQVVQIKLKMQKKVFKTVF